MRHAQNRKINSALERRTVIRILAVFSLAGVTVLAFPRGPRLVVADSRPSSSLRLGEPVHPPLRLRPEAAAAFPAPFLAANTGDRTDGPAAASALSAAANDC